MFACFRCTTPWVVNHNRAPLFFFLTLSSDLFLPFFFFPNVFLTQKYLAVMFSDSWWIRGASFIKWPGFSQARATVKYAWQKNKWGGVLRKCWCSRGTSVAVIYKSVLFATLMLRLLEIQSCLQVCPLFFFSFFYNKMEAPLHRHDHLLLSQPRLLCSCEHFVFNESVLGWSKMNLFFFCDSLPARETLSTPLGLFYFIFLK